MSGYQDLMGFVDAVLYEMATGKTTLAAASADIDAAIKDYMADSGLTWKPPAVPSTRRRFRFGRRP